VETFSALSDRDMATLHKLLGKVKDHATTRQELAQ
jgi:hypothetical protein